MSTARSFVKIQLDYPKIWLIFGLAKFTLKLKNLANLWLKYG